MCGRYGLTTSPLRMARLLQAAYDDAGFLPRYNVAPTQPVLVARNDAERSVVALRWGLVPSWSPGPQAMRLTTFNARIETIATAPAYREPLRRRRCAIFADGYYEWRRDADGAKTPMWIFRTDREPFVFAGLWDRWRPRDGGEALESCTIVTQPPNAFAAAIHSRMPVVLGADAARAWLAHGERDPRESLELLAPSPPELWSAHAVAPRVGNVRFDDPALVEPLS